MGKIVSSYYPIMNLKQTSKDNLAEVRFEPSTSGSFIMNLLKYDTESGGSTGGAVLLHLFLALINEILQYMSCPTIPAVTSAIKTVCEILLKVVILHLLSSHSCCYLHY